jgi:hypothetical protein
VVKLDRQAGCGRSKREIRPRERGWGSLSKPLLDCESRGGSGNGASPTSRENLSAIGRVAGSWGIVGRDGTMSSGPGMGPFSAGLRSRDLRRNRMKLFFLSSSSADEEVRPRSWTSLAFFSFSFSLAASFSCFSRPFSTLSRSFFAFFSCLSLSLSVSEVSGWSACGTLRSFPGPRRRGEREKGFIPSPVAVADCVGSRGKAEASAKSGNILARSSN